MKLSVLTTLYYSTPYLKEFYERITNSVKKITDDYEIIIVNDGSPDNSLEIVLELFESDKKIKIVDLSRNFGHHNAIVTGLEYVTGDYVFFVDCDLEEPPELIEQYWPEMINSTNVDVVYGIQKARKGNLFEKFSGELFFTLFNSLSDFKIPPNFCYSRLTTRRYTQAILEFPEKEMFLGGIWFLTGFNQKPIIIKKFSKGKSTYTLSKKIALAVNAITSFTIKPLEYIFVLGFILMALASIVIILLIMQKLFFNVNVPGWTSILVSLWFLGGLVIFNQGIIGVYLSKTLLETKNRPRAIVKKVYNCENNL
ncbi:MAG: glycosyl transferase [Candidatus Melainabacteria bacterium GWA2_34_9]|nr:MAG: glycosyl transferase [Candidatus Melainabacteria bacterium GWA2_34_9]